MIREAKITDSKELSEICTNDLGYCCDEKFIEMRIANLNKSRECVFVAVIDDKVVGFVHVERYDLLYYPSMANILGLAVSSQSRRQGIGEHLVASVENWAKGIGISELRVNSGGSRKEAHIFYRKMGFDNEKTQLRFTKQLSI